MSQRSRLIIGLVLAFAVLVGGAFIMPILSIEYFEDDWAIVVYSSVPYILCLIVSLAFAKFSKIKIPTLKPKISKFNPPFALWGVIMIFATQIIVSPLVHFIPDAYLSFIVDNQPVQQLNGFYPQLTLVFILPVLQQWTFRGIFQNNIAKALGPIWAIFLSALCFAITYISPREVVYMFGAGVTMAAIYYVTESLSTVIFISILFNGINYLAYLFFDTFIRWADIFGNNVMMYVIWWTISVVLVMITVWRVSNHHDKKLFLSKINKK